MAASRSDEQSDKSEKLLESLFRFESSLSLRSLGIFSSSCRLARLQSQSLNDGTSTVVGVRIAVGNQASEFLAKMAQLANAGVDEAQFGGGELSRRAARAASL